MKKPALSFYTNIPTPYQLSFFKELSKQFDLRVIYYASTESNRQWILTADEDYKTLILKDNFVARFFQKWILDFHFSWRIFSITYKDESEYVIVGGGYWIPNSVVAMLFSKLRNKKIAYFSEALFPAKNKFYYLIKCFFLQILNICCKAIFCIGKKAAESFDLYKVKVKKFIIVYNIDTVPFQHLNSEKLANFILRFKPANEVIILSSGSLIERKGMDVLIKAFRMINFNEARLIIIGEGPYKSELQQLAGNDERIIFAGFQAPAQVPFFFATADIFAFASRYDGWGVVINETIAANLPIICSDKVGAALELIDSPNNGIICESDNVDAFRLAIEGLLLDDRERNRIKRKAEILMPLISSKYNAESVYDIFIHQLQ